MDLNKEISKLLSEGVQDKSIFKAVFITGANGSGKDYVLKNALSGHGLTEINYDKLHAHLTNKDHNFHSREPQINPKKIKGISDLRHLLAIHGRNGLIVNGTGDDHKKTKEIKKHLENLGYDTAMVHVHSDDEVSKKRNIERSKRGGRAVPEKIRKEKWDNVQRGRQNHASMFANNYHEFDNSPDLRNSSSDVISQKKSELEDIRNKISEFVSSNPKSEKSQRWIDKQLSNTDYHIPRKGINKLPHPNSTAGKEATDLGLSYFGNGKYGKNRTVTHHTVSGNLVDISKKEKIKKKKLTELFNESVSITLSGDSTEEVIDLMRKIDVKEKGKTNSEYSFTDKNDSLTLGKISSPFGYSNEENIVTNTDISKIINESNYLTDSDNNMKIFVLRGIALKEAVQHQGIVIKNPNGNGYVVKINRENEETVSVINESIQTRTCISDRNNEKKESILCEEKISGKTLKDIKKSFNESIDKGIEPGLSMSASGENLIRKKDRNKKSDFLEINELTGDETTAGISSQKEDELKKVGIEKLLVRPKRTI